MEIKLLIGLGNPGPEYENTYHNVGQLFIDEVAGKKATFKKERHFEYINLKLKNLRILIKPLTFMNQSGGAAAAAKKYFNSDPREILVIHDDSDIPLGSFKLSFGRGSAGHQGIESIIKSLRTNKFYRLRIGIRPSFATATAGKPKAGLPAVTRRSSPSLGLRRVKAGELVLRKIRPGERKVLKNLFREIRIRYPEINGKAHLSAGRRDNP